MELTVIIVLLTAVFILLVWCFYGIMKLKSAVEKNCDGIDFILHKIFDEVLDIKILKDFRSEVRHGYEEFDEHVAEAEEEAEAAKKAEKAFTDGVSSILNYDIDKVRGK